MTISWQTCDAACCTPASLPLAAFSQIVCSLVFSSAVSVGAAAMLDLQAATASATPGLLDAGALAAALAAALLLAVVAAAAGAAAAVDDELDEELLLLLLPQAASDTPVTATTNSKHSLATMCPPL